MSPRTIGDITQIFFHKNYHDKEKRCTFASFFINLKIKGSLKYAAREVLSLREIKTGTVCESRAVAQL